MMLTDSSALVFLVPFVVGLFILMARLEIYFSKRRNQTANSRYLAEMNSTASVRGVRF